MIDLRSHTPKGQRARARILAAAEASIVTRGFHGASVRDIATAAGLPLATVVYHFAKKERLYAALLDAIAEELMADLAQVRDANGFVEALARWTEAHPRRVVLLLRELLDNPPRVARAAKFPLAPFLARGAELLGSELAVLHVVGAASYVVAAWPTVERIVGRDRARGLAAFRKIDFLAFARRALGVSHASRTAAPARPSRPRSSRRAHDRPRRRADAGAGRRVRR
jgi:AcrR family transcriptional regulator